MPRKVKLLNTRKFIEGICETIDFMLADNNKRPNGLCMPQLYVDNLRQYQFLGRSIIRNADIKKAKGNRKDIYVETK